MNWLSLPINFFLAQRFRRVFGIAAACLFLVSLFAQSTIAFAIDDVRVAWPRTATSAIGDKVTFSQPQVDEWRDGMLYVKVATKVQLANAVSSFEGTVSLRARTTINHGDRTVTLRDITVPALRFPANDDQIKSLQNAVTGSLKNAAITVAFDDLVASMQTQAFPTPASTIISNDPPRVVFRDSLIANVGGLSDSSVETIQSDGALKFDSIVAGQLEGAANTSTLFFRDQEGTYYLLVSGRWLTADSVDSAAWTFLEPAQLPTAFASIPESSRWAEALASVPNTPANRIALLAASLPSERTLPRSTTINVQWQGEPQFIATDTANVFCATNANELVLKLGKDFYCNTLDAWFIAANPNGPWLVCVKIPRAIASLQIQSPLFEYRFIQVADSTPTTVTFRSTSGAHREFVHDGVVVFGTGFAIPAEMAGIKPFSMQTHGRGMWWNPWMLGFSGDSCISIPIAEKIAAEALVPNSTEENHFVGLDGRVYAHRKDLWFRNSPDGQWIELTEQRSTLRVLKSDFEARQAAIKNRRGFFEWMAKQDALRLKSIDGCGRVLSMDGARPSTNGYRCAISAEKTEPAK